MKIVQSSLYFIGYKIVLHSGGSIVINKNIVAPNEEKAKEIYKASDFGDLKKEDIQGMQLIQFKHQMDVILGD